MIITATLYEVELIKQATKQKVIEELSQEIHNLYANQTHCTTENCESMGLQCDDCFYDGLQDLLTQKKGAEEQ